MAVDLHLDLDPNIVIRQSNFRSSEIDLELQCGSQSNRSSEVFRAALGCFYLSSV